LGGLGYFFFSMSDCYEHGNDAMIFPLPELSVLDDFQKGQIHVFLTELAEVKFKMMNFHELVNSE
jgi:hypothetical protein